MRFLGSRALISTSRIVLLFCGLAILFILTGCLATEEISVDPTTPATLSPVPLITTYATPASERTYTSEPLPSLSPSPSIEVVTTPVYDIPAELLLEACYPLVAEGTPIPVWFKPCSDFTYSENRRYLAYFIGPDICGRKIIILDLSTGELAFQTEFSGGHKFEFLANGKVLITTGHCEGGKVELLDPATGDLHKLGGSGYGAANNLWNTQHTALAVRTMPHVGYEGMIWGYNVSEDFLFLPEPEDWQLDNHLLWTPDGTHLLYQHRDMFPVEGTWTDSFPTGRQIIRVSAAAGDIAILVGDPDYDYHLCAGVHSSCDRWYGDWIQVRRYAYQPQQAEYTGEETPATQCLFYGMECEGEPILFALNWRTGEMIPWDESILPNRPP